MSGPGTVAPLSHAARWPSRPALVAYAAGLAAAFSLGWLLRGAQPPDSPDDPGLPRATAGRTPTQSPVSAGPEEPADDSELTRLRSENDRLRARIAEAQTPAPAEAGAATPAPVPTDVPPQSIEEMVEALRAALASGNEAEAKRLDALLRKLIGNDADQALRLLALAERESDPKLVARLYDLVKGNELISDPRLRTRVLELLRSHPNSVHKLAALAWINRALSRDGAFLKQIAEEDVAVSLSLLKWERDGSLRREAAQLLARFVDRPEVAAALREIAGRIGDEAVDARLAALEGVRISDAPETVALLLQVLRDDPDERMRRKAIESIAILAPQDANQEVVAALEKAIERETDDRQRGLALLSLIRVAPDSASPVIQRLLPTVQDPKQKELLTATLQMLDSGERDWLKIMLRLQGR